jgi:hypothetical protein
MSTDSHRERVTAAIRISLRPLDDDQVAARAGISPQQTVNQICQALERAGMVRRRTGPDGKIVNEWLGNRDREPGSIPGRATAAVPGPAHLLILPRLQTEPRRQETPLSNAVQSE